MTRHELRTQLDQTPCDLHRRAVVAVALDELERDQHQLAAPAPVEPLTERERDVLRLLGHGMSNKEIAGSLFISEGTARTYVSNILGKLGLASRTQAALYAVEHKLAEGRPAT